MWVEEEVWITGGVRMGLAAGGYDVRVANDGQSFSDLIMNKVTGPIYIGLGPRRPRAAQSETPQTAATILARISRSIGEAVTKLQSDKGTSCPFKPGGGNRVDKLSVPPGSGIRHSGMKTVNRINSLRP